MVHTRKPRIGIIGMGHFIYWPQFDGLKEELMDYRQGRQITIKGQRRGSEEYVDVQFDVTLAGAE